MHIPLHFEKGSRKAAILLWTVLGIAALLALIGVAALVYTLVQRNAQRILLSHAEAEQAAREARAELQRKDAEEKAQRALAQIQRDDMLSTLRSGATLLGQLALKLEEVREEAETLKTNDVGKIVAAHPDLSSLARRIYDSELKSLAAREEVAVRLESAKRMDELLVASMGSTFTPTLEMKQRADELLTWARNEDAELGRVRQSLATLVEESRLKPPPAPPLAAASAPKFPPSTTLIEAIDALTRKETASRLKTQDAITTDAQAKATLETANAEAERTKAQAKIEVQSIWAEFNAKKEEAERAMMEREAALKVQEANTKVVIQQREAEAQNVLLRQKANQPKVRQVLAPFTTPGYMQVRTFTAEKRPYSYTELQAYGALSPGIPGLAKLVKIASHQGDKVRPRWKMNHLLFQRHPDNIETATEAQNLLIELGPVLVEMGLLAP